MTRPRNDRKDASPFHRWVGDHFNVAVEGKSGLGLYCEGLLREAGIDEPPTRLSAVAELLGLESKPTFRPQAESGILDPRDGRIYLHRSASEKILTGTWRHVQLRFTYAHELAHALLYDFSVRPGVRLAPRPSDSSEEEVFCNKAAAQLLMPDFLLARTFEPGVVLSGQLLRQAARAYQVSLLAMVLRAEQVFRERLAPGEFHLLSGEIGNLRSLGRIEPRCAGCFLPPDLVRQKVRFLTTHKRLDSIHTKGMPNEPWSLVRFFKIPVRERPMHSGVEVELLKCGRHVVRLESQHHRLIGCRYVWTDGTIELL
jgi:hypothetical protein